MKRHILSVFITLAVILWAINSTAAVIAVMPFDDLSKGRTSVDFVLADYFSDQIQQKFDADLVAVSNMISFLKSNRIRNLGYLDSKHILAAKEQLGADFILIGSVSQNRPETAAIGIIVSLVRTRDARTVWANSDGVNLDDEQQLLGLYSPKKIDDLLPIVSTRLFRDFPTDLDTLAEFDETGTPIPENLEEAPIEIDSVWFSPSNVRPDQKIKCTVLFRSLFAQNEKPQIFLKVGNRVHLASTKDGNYYSASWVGTSDKKADGLQLAVGKNIKLATKDIDPALYEEIWSSSETDATYPVNLIVDWPSGKREESFLGSYIVDSVPPKVTLKLKGKKIDGMVAFREKLDIYVGQIKTEPISRWDISIYDKFDDLVLSSSGTGAIPNKFTWRGQNKRGFLVENGVYNVSVKIWDKAGNLGTASEKVICSKNISGIALDSIEQEDELHLSIDTNHFLPLQHWSFEMWSDDNRLLQKIDGSALPTSVTISKEAEDVQNNNVYVVLTIADVLGNRIRKRVNNIYPSSANASVDLQGINANGLKFEDTWSDDF